MTRRAEDRLWRCNACRAVTRELALLTAPSPFSDVEVLTGCPACRCCAEGFSLLCDEPGCKREASAGWPTGNDADAWDGYRQTCGAHASFEVTP